VLILALIIVALVPLYGILFPPLADLPQQLLVNKLLWEKLTGISHLDLEIPWFIGYRLVSIVIIIPIFFCQLFGIPLVYLPVIVSVCLISLHACITGTVLWSTISARSWESCFFVMSFGLPAVVAMYSACWFMGFVGFTLGITMLIPAIFLTERYINSGGLRDAVWVLIALFLVYAAHPFAILFWLVWWLSRGLASIATLSLRRELKTLLSLTLLFLPVVLYHLLSTLGSDMQFSAKPMETEFPLVSIEMWYQERLLGLLHGTYLKADEAANSNFFAFFVVGFFLLSVVLVIRSNNKRLKQAAVSGCLFVFIASWLNEKFIPVPVGHWLAYDYRFTSTVYVVCLTLAGAIFIDVVSSQSRKLSFRIFFGLLAVLTIVASVDHLRVVRDAYIRFDTPAREYMTKIFGHEEPVPSTLPRSQWYLDTTFMRRYVCLQRPDCNPAGTLFRNLGGNIYPVRLRSMNRIVSDEPSVDPRIAPVSAFAGGEGYGGGEFSRPRGIATDNRGNIYVADTGNGRGQKFDAEGRFLFAFGHTADLQLKEPMSIAADEMERIYVIDAPRGTLMRFTSEGVFEKEWAGADGGFHGPSDMAVGPNKDLYIIDQGQGRIVRFDPSAEAFSAWGTLGAGEGQFMRPTGITIGDGLVFVADLGNDRVQVFDLAGTFLRQWKVPEWGGYVWHYPDLAFDDTTKRLYATNGWKKEILVFDVNGQPAGSLIPNSPAGFANLSSLALWKNETGTRLYALNTASEAFDLGEPSVSVFDFAGR